MMRDDAVALGSLGALHLEDGYLDEAEACYVQALALEPDYAEAHFKLGNIFNMRRRLVAAEACYRRAIELAPDYVKAHYNLANTLRDQSRLVEAAASYRRVLEIDPEYAAARNNLSVMLMDQGRLGEAEESFRRVLEAAPDDVMALNNLGLVQLRQGRLAEAERALRLALSKAPEYPEAHNNLGVALKDQGRLDEAEASYRKALTIRPDYAEACSNLGVTLKAQGRFDEMEASYRRALQIAPAYTPAHNNLGIALREQGRLGEAEEIYTLALQIAPNNAQTYNNLGGILADQGRAEEAAASFRRALRIQPDYADAHSNLLFAINYSSSSEPSVLLEAARLYGQTVAHKAAARFSSWACSPKPERLRVGLVSGDFRNHPAGFFLRGLLTHLDTSRIELFAYHNLQSGDEVTSSLRARFFAWRPIADLSDAAAASLIHADGLHILIDLSGHTTANRLPLFAWKPAPLQASWLGYFATTGVAEIDYLLATDMEVPESCRDLFTETIWYLPETRLCFTAPRLEIYIADLPAIQNGAVTFGCFQNLSKIGDDVLRLWTEILTALPQARLRFQHHQLEMPAVRADFSRRLRMHHIDPVRVAMHGGVSREAYLAAHNEVDIVLDTFPYPGGTTTCEALWMGVPTLTLAGSTMLERQGASLLTAARLADWIATTPAEYVAKAIAFAGDLTKLAGVRSGLRKQVLDSPLFDAPRFARHFEDALWQMWRTHQASGTTGNPA